MLYMDDYNFQYVGELFCLDTLKIVKKYFTDTQGEEYQKEIVSLKHNDHILMDIADHGRNFRSVDIDQDTKGPPMHPRDNLDKQWSRVSGFLRPRIFCLEHGLEIEELLQSKGGADVLIICHSGQGVY